MNSKIEYFWKQVGRLKIRIKGNQSATLQFTPSKQAIAEGFARAQGCHKEQGNDNNNT